MKFYKAIADIKKNVDKQLYFSSNDLSLEQLKELASALGNNTSIVFIALNENNIGDDGATALATSLKNNKTIKVIELFGNQIGDIGAKALATLLQKNTSVNMIHLSKNAIGEEGGKAFGIALKHNFTISCVFGIENEEVKKYIARNIKLIDDAFKHAYEYLFSENNVNIVNGTLSLNAISVKDIYMLKHHENYVRNKLLDKKQINDYAEFAKRLDKYCIENFFKLKGYCKEDNNFGNLSALPMELIYMITNYALDDLAPKIAGEGKAETDLTS
jgi:hypothetical protein